jgi:hypothetical protein
MADELDRIWKESVSGYFGVLSQHSFVRTGELYGKLQEA